jgi:hypothetical protein
LDIVFYNETSGPAGSHLGDYLGGDALNFRAGMGAGGDLALLRLLVFVFRLAKAFMVAGDFSNIVLARVPEHPAGYRGYCHFIDYTNFT